MALGDRSKLRLLRNSFPRPATRSDVSQTGDDDRHEFEAASESGRQLQEDKGAKESEGGLSAETLALLFTGVLAVAGYIFQAKTTSSFLVFSRRSLSSCVSKTIFLYFVF